jgi:hypothetical protein
MSPSQPHKRIQITARFALIGACVAARAGAQARPGLDLGGAMIEVGGEEERYLRALQVAGRAPLTQWTIEPFSPAQVRKLRRLSSNPWNQRVDTIVPRWQVLRPNADVIENSAFPFQIGGGPTWAGRGITGDLQAGLASSWWNKLYFQAAPVGFLAQNAAFALAPNGATGSGQFADARFPDGIDAPQRFGDKSYGRIDPGSSFAVVDAAGIFLGASSAPQRWGPGRDYPLLLGPNAGGFPNIFAGTSEPVNLWLFRIHGRVEYGSLAQSAYAAPVEGERRRFGSGLILTMLPRGIPGLEIGGARFSFEPWPDSGFSLSTFSRPFSGGLNLTSSGANNQLFENENASLFFRWAVPAVRSEFYGEWYREDFPGQFHRTYSIVDTPDDYTTLMLGFQRVLASKDSAVRVFRAELVNGESSHTERGVREFVTPLPPYIHSVVTQGATLNGLILGSPEAYGGSGWRIGVDDFSPAGRLSISFERSLRLDWLRTLPTDSIQLVHPDVIYGVRTELLRFRGTRGYKFTLIPAIDLNRNLAYKHDVFNLTAAVTVNGW